MRFPLCEPGRLVDLFARSELDGVEIAGLEIPTEFVGFDDYWTPLLGGQGPAPSYVMSLEAQDRDKLRARLRQMLPKVNGRISLTARAWAVKGIC